MSTALDLALIDIGLWGLGAIALLWKMSDRARLVNPQKQPAEKKDETATPPQSGANGESPISVTGSPSHGEAA